MRATLPKESRGAPGGQARLFTLLVACIALAAIGTRTQNAAAQDKTSPVQLVMNPLADVDGNAPTDPSTPLYSKNEDPLEAITAPDGHHITLGEWQEVDGVGNLTRTSEGTQVDLELTGLVPNGVYTAWTFLYQDPPFNFSTIANIPDNVGRGAVGAIDGSEARFDADDNGAASFSAVIPPGPLSVSGEASSWILDGYSSVAILGLYANDGQTYGPVPGPHGVGAFTVGFVPEPSSVALLLTGVCGLAGAFAVRRSRRR